MVTTAVAVPRAAQAPVPLGQAVAYQIDAAHDGVAAGSTLTPPLSEKWRLEISATAFSYPLIADGRVFVTVARGGLEGTKLMALDAATGAELWERVLQSSFPVSSATYGQGRVFVLDDDGFLRAFDASTGTLRWRVDFGSNFTSPPTAFGGAVYMSGADRVRALDGTDGRQIWTALVQSGEHSAPAVANQGVFASYNCPHVYRFARLTGQQIWHYGSGCSSPGGRTPTLHGSRLYVRDEVSTPSGYVFDAQSGSLIRRFEAAPAPALAGNYGFFLTETNGQLEARDLTSWNLLWATNGDGQLTTAPVVANGVVYMGSASGQLVALDEVTGGLLWQTNVGASIPPPDEHNESGPLTGLGIGGGLLVVPASGALVAYGN